jgi:hypothetical protein
MEQFHRGRGKKSGVTGVAGVQELQNVVLGPKYSPGETPATPD